MAKKAAKGAAAKKKRTVSGKRRISLYLAGNTLSGNFLEIRYFRQIHITLIRFAYAFCYRVI